VEIQLQGLLISAVDGDEAHAPAALALRLEFPVSIGSYVGSRAGMDVVVKKFPSVLGTQFWSSNQQSCHFTDSAHFASIF
jgi:hypothetical protein